MHVVYYSESVKNQLKNAKTVVAIGNFDGVHLGHQALLSRLQKVASEKKLVPVVLTFAPHPRRLFSPDDALPELTVLRDKVALLFQLGVKAVCLQRFDHQLASIEGAEFIDNTIVGQLNAAHIVVGDDFGFGKNRACDADCLRKTGAQHQIVVDIVEKVLVNDQPVSSTLIRQLLRAGCIEKANRLLGRAFCFTSRVVSGKQLGRKIGFPTLNLRPADHTFAISGVFVVTADILGKSYPAIANVGTSPTVENTKRVQIEVHILDTFSEQVNHDYVTVHFLHKIRDEIKFDTLDNLIAAIQKDYDAAVTYFDQTGTL